MDEKDVPEPTPAKFLDLYPPPHDPMDDFPEGKDPLDYDPAPIKDDFYPYYGGVEVFPDIPVKFENEDQYELFWNNPFEKERMERNAIYQFFFPEITNAQKTKIYIRQSIDSEEHDSIETFHEKVRAYYLKVLDDEKKKAELEERDRKLLEAVKEAARDREPKKKGKRGNGRQGLTQKEAIDLISEMGFKQISDRQIRNWNNGINAPPGYPGLNDAVVFRTWLASAKIKGDLKIRIVNMGSDEMTKKKRR